MFHIHKEAEEVLTCDRKASESPLLLQRLCLTNSSIGRQYDRVEDEAILKALDLPHHFCLRFDGTVVVYDT